DMDMAIESFQSEAVDFVTKPINVDALEASLMKVHEKIAARKKLRQYTENLEKTIAEKTERLTAAAGLLESGDGVDQYHDIGERFRHLFDELPCYVTVQDKNLRLTAMNKQFRRDFGNELGAHCFEVTRQYDAPCPKCPVMDTFEDGKSHQAEMELTTPNGLKTNVLTWTSALHNDQGEVTHVLVMYTELTQILHMQNHLASLGLMIGSVSHGIKGLLTGLDGGMYLLDSGLAKENETQIKDGLEVIKNVSSRIRNLVLDVLLFSKERDLKKEWVNVTNLAEDTACLIDSKMRDAKVRFIREFAPNLGQFEVDPGFLRTALINILENAVDACLDDKQKEEHSVSFKVKKDGDRIVFDIIDNGIGMDDATRDKMFSLFFSSKGQQGTGLGLYITNRIIEQHGGRITVDSTPGQGTHIGIRIPQSS
ncbi:MAG: GHKL domain-containing protein, partial [Deltaproteobacteria bacterium]|nr:GHKL domain-containing protein [Deltaproteobacteria bacterium]